jgi:hypothetical protein
VQLNYGSAWKYFQSVGLAAFESLITTTSADVDKKQSGGWFGGGIKELSFPGHEAELKFPFLVAQVDYNPQEPDHLAMLRSIALALCGASLPDGSITAELAATGGHWEAIGFQGMDPRTDLNRSMKMLTILQTVHFIESDSVLAQASYKLSRDETLLPMKKGNSRPIDSSWPFMCVSVMFTKEAIQALRSGALNAECNKAQSVLQVANTFHHACFRSFVK